ncbi:hypothetical protein OIY81_769 [Cryptosporidium canis]|nr:hypothetical protein OIY81_769 [Cryptosporidium canis]
MYANLTQNKRTNAHNSNEKVQRLRHEKEKIKEWNENLTNLVTNVNRGIKNSPKRSINVNIKNNRQNDNLQTNVSPNGRIRVENKKANEYFDKKFDFTNQKANQNNQLEDQYTLALIEKQNIEESCNELKKRYNQLVLRFEEAIEQKESFREGLKNKINEYQKLQELHNGTQSLLAVGNKAQEELYQTQKQFQIILGKRNVEFANLKDELEAKKIEFDELEKKFELLEDDNKKKEINIEQINKEKTTIEEQLSNSIKNNQDLKKERDQMKRELKIYEPLSRSKEMVDKMAAYLETLLIKRNEVISEITQDLSKNTGSLTEEISNIRKDIVGIEKSIQKFSDVISHFKNNIIANETQRIQESDLLVKNLKTKLKDAKEKIINLKRVLFHSVGRPGNALEPSLTFEVRNGSILHKLQGNHGNTVKCYCRIVGTSLEYTTSSNIVKNISLEKVIGIDYGNNSNSFRRINQPKGFFYELFKRSTKDGTDEDKNSVANMPWLFFSIRILDGYDSTCTDFIATSLESAMSWIVTIGRYATYIQRSKGLFTYSFIQTKNEFYSVSLRMKMMYLCQQKELNISQLYITAIHTCCLKNPQLIRNQVAWNNLKNIMRRITNQKFPRDEFFQNMKSRSENKTCFDCESRNPTWLSLSFAVFICLNCSSDHRKMGVHISFVRSSDLDKFTPSQLLRMDIGGNHRARNYFKQVLGSHFSPNTKEYANTLCGRQYKQILDAETTEYERKHSKKCNEPEGSSKVDFTSKSDNTSIQTAINAQTMKFKSMPSAINRYNSTQRQNTINQKGRRLDENFDFDSFVS